MLKKLLSIFLALLLTTSVCLFAFKSSAVDLCEGVTEEMCYPEYWSERTIIDADEVLMTTDDIINVNQAGVDGVGTYIMGIETLSKYNAYKQQQNLNPAPTSGKSYYINGVKIDADKYFSDIREAIHSTGFTETEREPDYAVTVRCTYVRDIPTVDVIGTSPDDTDDEMVLESVTVNEPFAIRAKCTINNKEFYYGYTLDCPGWICGDDLAICSSKEEWLDAWKCDLDAKDFIVVTCDKMNLETSVTQSSSSNLRLRLGTALKLVPKEQIPVTVDNRSTWNNYVVYIPVRQDDGTYSKEIALIPQHSDVSTGYLPYTQSNMLDIAFKCLGNVYGWAGWLESYDCSLYTRSIFRCFGIVFPRNATWQRKVPDTKYDLTGMNDEEKQKFIETLPAGAMLFFTGHTMMYIGTVNGVSYVINSVGTLVEPSGDTTVKKIYNTVITPLTARRGASYGYKTWLSCMSEAVVVSPKYDISKCTVSAEKGCCQSENDSTVTVSYNNFNLYKNINYSLEIENNTVTVNGIGFFSGEIKAEIKENHSDSDKNDKCDDCGIFISGNFFTHILFMIRKIFGSIIISIR